MPELPEVETVRVGLQRGVVGRRVTQVSVGNPRSVRRHPGGGADLAARLVGARVDAVQRRGKYLWLVLDRPGECVLAHLGMSGQLLVAPADAPGERHLHVRISFADGGELRFVDQRTFGGLVLDRLVDPPDGRGAPVPSLIAHIARDPMDPLFDEAVFAARLRRRDTELKRALLDQSLISGIGNIYADESLWRARLNGRRRTATLPRRRVGELLAQVRAVLVDALAAGGTSFDALYVDVNGTSGYFDRSLAVYGRAGEPCPRCGRPIRRVPFMNRSSYYCPRCQPAPRTRAPDRAAG